jgi:hypothetical protein
MPETVVRDAKGTVTYYMDGDIHRDHDSPAVVTQDGDQHWYRHGIRHRAGGRPAVMFANGDKQYWVKGVLHRDGDCPAIENAHGSELEWYKHGVLHREGDQPAVSRINTAFSKREWWRHGLRHRDPARGPAVMFGDILVQDTWSKRMDEEEIKYRGRYEFSMTYMPNPRNEWWQDGVQIYPPHTPSPCRVHTPPSPLLATPRVLDLEVDSDPLRKLEPEPEP